MGAILREEAEYMDFIDDWDYFHNKSYIFFMHGDKAESY